MATENPDLSAKLATLEAQLAVLQNQLQHEASAHQKTLGRIGALETKLNNSLTINSLIQISKIYPKTRRVVFVGSSYFGDNIKYGYLAFAEYARQHNIACHYLTDDVRQHQMLSAAGFSSIMPFTQYGTIDDFHILSSAKVTVLNDYFYPSPDGSSVAYALLRNAKCVQLWHGIPLKEIGLKTFSSAEIMASCGTFDSLVATNKSSRDTWAQRFSFHDFAPLGYPRNDVFFRDATTADLLNVDRENLAKAQNERQQNIPVVLYAPTFRNHNGVTWLNDAKLGEIGQYCQTRGYALYVNMHPLEQHAVGQLKQQYPNINFIMPHSDIYPFVKMVDVMVTDYSSLAFDYLLLDRPLVFYRPDHADYISKSRPLIPEREHYSCGETVTSFEDLTNAIDRAVLAFRTPDQDHHRKSRHALRQELFDHNDGHAGQRVNQLITRYLDEAS